ncbi:MAG: acetyltransferase [Flavobacteriia bacterium]|jgi:sugar O-acyltransferase (sialic acid O-acetyltransferase NeuD family)
MLIIGAGGLAKDILQDLPNYGNHYFYDELDNVEHRFIDGTIILHEENEVRKLFQERTTDFIVAVGGGQNRFHLIQRFEKLGGTCISLHSERAQIGQFDNLIDTGTILMHGCIISNSIKIGKGCLIYTKVFVAHDCSIGNYCEFAPGATILGGCQLGDFVFVGASSTILPNVKIGNNVTIGAGSIVTRNVEENSIVAGNPAKLIRRI